MQSLSFLKDKPFEKSINPISHKETFFIIFKIQARTHNDRLFVWNP
jgi:hypothetical protein